MATNKSTQRPRTEPPGSGEYVRIELQHELDVQGVELEMQQEQLRATEAELEESRDHHHDRYDLAPVGFVTLDASGKVIEANLRAAEVLGVTRHELVGQPLAAFMGEEDIEKLHLHLWGVLASGERHGCEIQFRGRGLLEGRIVPMRLESLPRATAGRMECALIDPSDLRRERETHRATEAQLHHASNMEAIGTLASGVAHDFNNLLMGVRSCATIALSKLDSESPVRMYLDEIRQATINGAGITQQLLEFGRAREGTPAVFELNALVKRAERLLSRLLGEDVGVRVNLSAEDSRVRIDPVRLEQVLLNLAINARQAMPGGGMLTIETSRVAVDGDTLPVLDPGPYVVLAVADTGIGMTEDTRQRVFEPFFTTKAGVGTGLGLSTAHGLVRQAKGHIRVESELGVGSRFEVLLPHVDEPLSHAIDVPDETPMTAQGGTILLVEDESLVRMGTRFYLQQAGYRVLEASTGPEAIECCAKFSGNIDLLLSDVVLPGMGGRDIAREVRDIRPGLPVLFMSAHSKEMLISQGRLGDNATVLQKPFDADALVRRITGVLASSHSERDRNHGIVEAEVAGAPPLTAPRGTVLVVEDERLARQAICEHLRDAGWIVSEAETPEQAIVMARRKPIHVLLTDYRLPGMTGDALARHLVKLNPKTRVVYMSGLGGLEFDPPGLILTKPLELDEVAEAVEAARATRGGGSCDQDS